MKKQPADPTPARIQEVRKWQSANPLRTFRTQHKITLAELAAAIGISVGTIQQWESGARDPRPAAIAKLTELMKQDAAAAWELWKKRRPRTL